MSGDGPRLLLLELNEFNRDLLAQAADELDLPNVRRLVGLRESRTLCPDEREGHGLDPWVQWVSVHTGLPSSRHAIRNLGDVPDLDAPQLWERLGERGVSSGVWGAMNASRGNAPDCRFFLPDPWSFSEEAHPAELDPLLALPRYMAKNYLNVSPLALMRHVLRFGSVALRRSTLGTCLLEAPRLIELTARYGRASFVPFCFYEHLSALRFLDYQARYRPRFSVLFLNGLAHLQHYYWSESLPYAENRPLRYGLRFIDDLLGRLHATLGPGDALAVMNGFTQVRTTGERAEVMYRQRDHAALLRAFQIEPVRVEALMSNDAHVFLASPEERARAQRLLEDATVEGDPAFLVETAADHPDRLFYRFVYHDEAKPDTELRCNGRQLPLLAHFERIVRRTGAHRRDGTIFCTQPIFPDELANHEVFDHVSRFFDAAS